MIQHVNAIFEQGILRPLAPLNLQDHEEVSLAIEKIGDQRQRDEACASTLLDVLAEAGLVGCIKDAPTDLSTNPRYMEGFGKSGG